MQQEKELAPKKFEEKRQVKKSFSLTNLSKSLSKVGPLGSVLLANVILIIVLSFLSPYFFKTTNITKVSSSFCIMCTRINRLLPNRFPPELYQQEYLLNWMCD